MKEFKMNLTNDTICKTILCLMVVNYEMTKSGLCPIQVGPDLFNILSCLQTISWKNTFITCNFLIRNMGLCIKLHSLFFVLVMLNILCRVTSSPQVHNAYIAILKVADCHRSCSDLFGGCDSKEQTEATMFNWVNTWNMKMNFFMG